MPFKQNTKPTLKRYFVNIGRWQQFNNLYYKKISDNVNTDNLRLLLPNGDKYCQNDVIFKIGIVFDINILP